MRVGECLMLGFYGRVLPQWLIEFEKKFGLGGVILFDYSCQTKSYENNIISHQQVKNLCAQIHSLGSKPLIFIDQEGGKVRRLKEKLGFAPLPSQKQFAELEKIEKVSLLQKSFSEMKDLGIDYDLTPVIDLNLNPQNPNIGAIERSFGVDTQIVKQNVEIINHVAKDVNLGLCLKHFPGLGGAKVDSHTELTDITQTFSETEMNLFFELAPHLSGNAILLSHGILKTWDSRNPVSMSPVAIKKIREKSPDSLLISDDIQMVGLLKHYSIAEACLQGLRAGLDMVLLGNNLMGEEENIEKIAQSMQTLVNNSGDVKKQFEESTARILSRKNQFI